MNGPVQPDALVPFSVDEGSAKSAFANWISHRWFAPRSLTAGGTRVSAADGVFLPFWSFSAGTSSTYVGHRGETRHRQVMRTQTDAQGNSETRWETETETEWRRVSGQVGRDFEGLMVPACTPVVEKTPSWSLAGLRPYAPGSEGDKRIVAFDVAPESGFGEVMKVMRTQIESDVREDIGGKSQRVSDTKTTYIDEACSLLLLPAWLISYTHRGRSWSVLVNGVSGEVAGNRPYSAAKISLLVGGAAAIAAAVTVLALWH